MRYVVYLYFDLNFTGAVYNFKYFQGLSFGLFEFEDPIARSDFLVVIYFNGIEESGKFQ